VLLSFTSTRVRLLGLALLVVAVPACGLSEYEKLMHDTQEREARFRLENKYLDAPVQIPTQKDKDDHDVPVANVFFRPPKGISSKAEGGPFLWHYRARSSGDFVSVDMAFAPPDDKDFVAKVFNYYPRAEGSTTPTRNPPLPFDSWEFDSAQQGYSINITKGSGTKVAIVYVFGKGRREALRQIIDLSLQSLGVDQQANAARLRYNQKSPWKLQN
jgi:hypothetical protein